MIRHSCVSKGKSGIESTITCFLLLGRSSTCSVLALPSGLLETGLVVLLDIRAVTSRFTMIVQELATTDAVSNARASLRFSKVWLVRCIRWASGIFDAGLGISERTSIATVI